MISKWIVEQGRFHRLWSKATEGSGSIAIPEGKQFVIQPAKKTTRTLCLRPRDETGIGMTLAIDDGNPHNDWLSIGGDRIMHVASGKFLSSDATHYVFFKDPSQPYEQDCNYVQLGVRSGDDSDEQRWFFEQEVVEGDEQHEGADMGVPQGADLAEGGNVLRHFKDGMCMDICNWDHKENAIVGQN